MCILAFIVTSVDIYYKAVMGILIVCYLLILAIYLLYYTNLHCVCGGVDIIYVTTFLVTCANIS